MGRASKGQPDPALAAIEAAQANYETKLEADPFSGGEAVAAFQELQGAMLTASGEGVLSLGEAATKLAALSEQGRAAAENKGDQATEVTFGALHLSFRGVLEVAEKRPESKPRATVPESRQMTDRKGRPI